MSAPLTKRLAAARRKYGAGIAPWEQKEIHLREHDGLRQVIRYRGPEFSGPRDASGVQVLAETRDTWESIGCEVSR